MTVSVCDLQAKLAHCQQQQQLYQAVRWVLELHGIPGSHNSLQEKKILLRTVIIFDDKYHTPAASRTLRAGRAVGRDLVSRHWLDMLCRAIIAFRSVIYRDEFQQQARNPLASAISQQSDDLSAMTSRPAVTFWLGSVAAVPHPSAFARSCQCLVVPTAITRQTRTETGCQIQAVAAPAGTSGSSLPESCTRAAHVLLWALVLENSPRACLGDRPL